MDVLPDATQLHRYSSGCEVDALPTVGKSLNVLSLLLQTVYYVYAA